MAKVAVVFHQAGNRSLEAEPMPVARLPGSRSQVLSTGNASVATTIGSESVQPTGRSRDGGFVTVTANGGSVWITSGANPVAAVPAAGATGTGFPLLNGASATFAVADGEKIAAVDWVV